MNRSLKRFLIVVCLFTAVLLLSSCTNSTEELYQLPKTPEQNSQLQGLIDDMLAHGAAYSPPSSGTHRQSVQLEDLDGDNVREAISFFQVTGDDKPLKVHIFRYIDGDYQQVAVIEGEGESIDSISYADMDGSGTMELIIGWQISSEIKLLTIYTINDFHPYMVESIDYTDYALCNLAGEGKNVFVVRLISSDQTGEAVLYSLQPDGELEKSTASLSSGIISVSRIRSSTLLNGVNSVYMEGTTAEGFLTDIFTMRLGAFTNITLNTGSASSSDTFRTLSINCTDINNDGTLDIPIPVALNSSSESTTTYYAIRWYSYSSSGRQSLTQTTFHNSTDGWYIVLSDNMIRNLYVRRDTSRGTRSVVFSTPDAVGVVRDLLAVTALTGDNREDNSLSGNRFLLSTKGDVIYTGEILTGDATFFGISKDNVSSNFHLIYSEWVTSDK